MPPTRGLPARPGVEQMCGEPGYGDDQHECGAMTALQSLNRNSLELETVQKRISTGLAVSTAKDNGGVFAIAQSMRADVRSYSAVSDSINLVTSLVDVALAGGEAISDLLVELKEKALAGSDASLDAASRTALNEDFKALRDQIGTIVSSADFNGTNLINGTTSAVAALANANASSSITIAGEDLSLAGSIITLSAAASFDSAGAASSIVTTIESSLDNLNASLARLGTGSKALAVHQGFISKLSDAVEGGIGNLVDADLAAESARLQALQVKQALGVQALAIANSAPSMTIGFFQ